MGSRMFQKLCMTCPHVLLVWVRRGIDDVIVLLSNVGLHLFSTTPVCPEALAPRGLVTGALWSGGDVLTELGQAAWDLICSVPVWADG